MRSLLLLAILALPLVEIALFVVVGREIGVLATIACVLATAVIGVSLVRAQGFATFERARREMGEDRVPAGALGEGVAILAAGALLIIPGFFTDAFGFLLLVPPVRRAILAFIGTRLAGRVTVVHGGSARRPRGSSDSDVIEGEAVEVEEQDRLRPPDGDSPWRRG